MLASAAQSGNRRKVREEMSDKARKRDELVAEFDSMVRLSSRLSRARSSTDSAQADFLQRHDAALAGGYHKIGAQLPVQIAARYLPEALLAGSAPRSNLEIAVQHELVKAFNKAESAKEMVKIVPVDCVRGVTTLVQRAQLLRAAMESGFSGLQPGKAPWALARRADGEPLQHFGELSETYLRVQDAVRHAAVQAAGAICERVVQDRLRLALRFNGVLRTNFLEYVHDAPSAEDIATLMGAARLRLDEYADFDDDNVDDDDCDGDAAAYGSEDGGGADDDDVEDVVGDSDGDGDSV